MSTLGGKGGILSETDTYFERRAMEWVPVIVIVVFLTGLGIVTGYAIKHAKKS